MLERFTGSEGGRRLLEAVCDQQCVGHDRAVAEAVCQVLKLVVADKGDLLMKQGAADNDIFLILAGQVSIQVNGRELAIRRARQHIGEMAMIDPSTNRSATAVALEKTVVARVSEADFIPIANRYPDVWRRLAVELGDRLRQRSQYVRAPNPRPVVFIASSREGVEIARRIQLGLDHDDFVVQVWTDNLFVPGRATMEDLERRTMTADFGVIVCTPDDQIVNSARGVDQFAPRDNVILELGMCLGALGRYRTFLVRPRRADLKIPTDMLGITPIDYEADDAGNLDAHIAPVCTQIRDAVRAQKSR